MPKNGPRVEPVGPLFPKAGGGGVPIGDGIRGSLGHGGGSPDVGDGPQ